MDRRRAALYATVSLMLAAVLAIVPGLAAGAVPTSWGWVHNGVLLWSIVGFVVIASVGIGVVQARMSSDRRNPDEGGGGFGQ